MLNGRLYVATNLTAYRDEKGGGEGSTDLPTDLVIAGLPYRKLDPAYYAWLRSRMEKAKGAWQGGRLDEGSFNALREKFNRIHDEAVGLFGETALLRAVRSLDPKTYPAPTRCSGDLPHIPGKGREGMAGQTVEQSQEASLQQGQTHPTPTKETLIEKVVPFRFPERDDPTLPNTQRVRPSALGKVRTIESQALAAGWTMSELYQNRGRFPYPSGLDYGIACFIGTDQTLGEVTDDSIELITRSGRSLFFRRRGREHMAVGSKPAPAT